MPTDPIIGIFKLQKPWQTIDPFLFCMHHDDRYPQGNDNMGPVTGTAGRDIGSDFSGKDGWSMYHGPVVPGFPRHPHRGFETITIVRKGYVDHSDSMGATARYGMGDVQWMTAGRGIEHAEMFPLTRRDKDNHLELFQIWLNLPRTDKMVEPYFTMLWADDIPGFSTPEGASVSVIAGELDGLTPPKPPPSSWASRDEAQVGIFTVRLEPGASWTLPPAASGVERMIYVFEGALKVGDRRISAGNGAKAHGDQDVPMVGAEGEPTEVLVLQARPMREPVMKYGPFVMNNKAEIVQAIEDYRAGKFGVWPWGGNDPTHVREEGRFAKHADGRVERPKV